MTDQLPTFAPCRVPDWNPGAAVGRVPERNPNHESVAISGQPTEEEAGGDKCPWSVGWYDASGRKRSKKVGSKSMATKFARKKEGELAANGEVHLSVANDFHITNSMSQLLFGVEVGNTFNLKEPSHAFHSYLY